MEEKQILVGKDIVSKMKKIKIITLLIFLSAVACGVLCFQYYFKQTNFEYLILGIVNILIGCTLICVAIWIYSIEIEENGSLVGNNSSYFVQLGLQTLCALSGGLIITCIQLKTYTNILCILEIITIILLMILINYTKQLNSGSQSTHRFIIFGTLIINACMLFQAAFDFKFFVYLINNQVIPIENTSSIFLMKYALIVLLIVVATILILVIQRTQNYFVAASYIALVGIIIAATANGVLIEDYFQLKKDLSTQIGCRNALQSVGESTLQNEGICSIKYLKQNLSPYLPCPQQEQTYLWELGKMDQLGCINKDCCQNLQTYLVKQLQHLIVWINLIIAIGIVQSFNIGMLACFVNKNNIETLSSDLLMIFGILSISAIVILIFNSIGISKLQLQDQIVPESQILNQLTILPIPNYSEFVQQKRLTGISNLQTCELAKNLMLKKVDFTTPQNLKKPGLLLAIQGTEGQFTVLGDYNRQDVQFLNIDELALQIFPNSKKLDTIIVQGSIASISDLIGQNLYYCSEYPENADFQIHQEFIELQQNQHRILELDQNMQKQLHNFVEFYNIKAIIQNSDDFSVLSDVKGTLYEGLFIQSSCQVMDEIQSPFLEAQSNLNGEMIFNQVGSKQIMTLLVKKKGFKNACAVVDLTNQNPKTTIYVRMINDVNIHSMKIMLEWTSNVLDLDLYGQFKVNEFTCLTGSLSKSCGGMSIQSKNNKDQHIEILTIDQIQQFTYLIFVKRFMQREQAITNNRNALDWVEAQPVVTVYVNELQYPVIQFRLSPFNQNFRDKIDLTWLVFQMDGKKGDQPYQLNDYWSEISNENIQNEKAYTSKFWPSPR